MYQLIDNLEQNIDLITKYIRILIKIKKYDDAYTIAKKLIPISKNLYNRQILCNLLFILKKQIYYL